MRGVFPELTARKFADIDRVLAQRDRQEAARAMYSDKGISITSHHFLVVAGLDIDIPGTPPKSNGPTIDMASCVLRARQPALPLSLRPARRALSW
eukprot:826692-Pyramimonas_sp.AAC.1